MKIHIQWFQYWEIKIKTSQDKKNQNLPRFRWIRWNNKKYQRPQKPPHWIFLHVSYTKIKEFIQKYMNLRHFDHHSASHCALHPRNAVPKSISKKCVLAFPWKSHIPDAMSKGMLKRIFSKSTSGLRFSDAARNVMQNGSQIVANWYIFVWVS